MIKEKIIYILILFQILIGFAVNIAQTNIESPGEFSDEKFVVDSIKINGNDITEEFIILRELTFTKGDTVTFSQLSYNRERVFSLGLFSKVSIYPEGENAESTINIDVEETWYIYPIPFLRRADKSSDSYAYGIDFLVKNFRGRNEDLHTLLSLGYDPHFMVYYDNPALVYEDGLGFTFALSYLNSINKSEVAKQNYGEDYHNKYYSVSASLYKIINQFNTAEIVTGFDYISVPADRYFKGISASGTNLDRMFSLGFKYFYDSRDLKQFPQKGIFTELSFLHRGFGINNINYNLLSGQYQEYEKVIDELTTRWRIAFRSALGRLVPYYDYSFLGYDEYVRGRSNDRDEGKYMVISSFEVSYPVLKEFDFSIKLPLLPRSLTSARIGIYLTAFADAGHAFNNFDLHFNDFNSGYGLGITFLVLPYNAIRIEFAIGDNGNKEFILGTGFAF